jgi:hypothetical protein
MKLPLVAIGVAVATAVAIVGTAWAFGLLDGEGSTASTTVARPAGFPEGVFRYTMTRDDVLALDAALAPGDVANSVGTFTWTIRNGRISLDQTDCNCTVTGVVGRYTADVPAKQLTVHWNATTRDGQPFCVGTTCVDTVGWSYDGKALHITPLDGLDRDDLIFWGDRKPWVKIG